MFIDIFLQLCADKGVKPTRVAHEIGSSSASVVKWKKGAIPQGATLQKIADYFGVSVDYLLTGEDKKTSVETSTEYDDKFVRLQRAYRKMDPETQARAIKTLEAAFGEFFSDDYIDDDTEE